MFTIKPLEKIIDQGSKKESKIVTIENHSIYMDLVYGFRSDCRNGISVPVKELYKEKLDK